jgi:hypothetical protein
MNRLLLGLPVIFGAALVPTTTRADETVPCADAASEGQRLKNDHKLVEARVEFQNCARRQCPLIVQTDCLKWLEDVNTSLPTVVVTAKDASGADLVDVKVNVDGQPLVSKLDGQAVPIDPGRHVFQFSMQNGTELDQGAIIREGVKDQSVNVVLGSAVSRSPRPLAGVPGVVGGGSPAPESRVWNTVGWVLGGSGLLGLAVGGAFGAVAIHDNDSASCNASKQCLPGPLSDARTAAVGSDIGFIAGGLLVAGGVTLVLLTPRRSSDGRGMGVNVIPLMGPGESGVALRGFF